MSEGSQEALVQALVLPRHFLPRAAAKSLKPSMLSPLHLCGPHVPAGPCLTLAKAVQDCAQGAMVLMAEDTFSKLGVEELRTQLLVGCSHDAH